jgi:steroid 5-alpha reductase family enzyme
VSLLQVLIVTVCIGAGLIAIMIGAWSVQRKTGSSRWVDATWTFGTGGIAFIAALLPLGTESWPHWRQLTIAVLAGFWSLRLGLHIAARNREISDDPRYRKLNSHWGEDAPRRMFWFLQSQAAVGIVLALSIALATHNANPALRIQDLIGVTILIGAIVGESIADRQLRLFASDPANRGGVCDVGLWRLSRHPNYFFEWLAWTAYPVIAIDASGHNPYGWAALLAPICMYWVLAHVSGIPPLEEHMLSTRGDAYRTYQRRTRSFFLLPKF